MHDSRFSNDWKFNDRALHRSAGLRADLVELNDRGEIIVDGPCRTNKTGIYAGGDLTTVPYKQIIIAMGEGAKAGPSAFEDFARGNIEQLS